MKQSIIEYLRENLRKAGADRWEAIAFECGIAKTLPRKIACMDRQNPGVATIQPLFDFFQAVDRGQRSLPPSSAKPSTTTEQGAGHA